MISLPYLRENTAKISKIWRVKPAARTTSGAFLLPPAQESEPGNDGDVPAESKRAGISLILHGQHGFSIRSSFEHRGIIIS